MPGEKPKARKRLRLGMPELLLIAVIVIQLLYTVFCFSTKKTGFYGDEIWGYGLANSYYQPFIYLRPGVNIDESDLSDLINFYEWVDGSAFEEYITVQPNERFAYGSVYSNQTFDHHPPLYYILLHTVCSFFPNSFSFLYAFVLNCIFLVITQLYFYRLGALVTKSKKKALLLCVLYGGGTGALSTFLYLRQYSLLTMLVMMHTYYAAQIYYTDARSLKKQLIPAALTALAAFFTHYYGVIYVGALTAVMCIYFLCKKRIKTPLAYGGTMLLSLGAFVGLYPAVIRQMMGETFSQAHSLDYFEQMRLLLNSLFSTTIGVRVHFFKSAGVSYVLAGILLALAVIVPLCFLFRKDKWFIKLKERVIGYFSGVVKRIKHSRRNLFPLFIALTLTAAVLAINWQVDFYYYFIMGLRYLFFLLPFVCLTVFYLIDAAMVLLIPVLKKHSVKIMAVVCTVMLFNNADCKYFFQCSAPPDEVRDALAGKNCVLVIREGISNNLLSTFPSYFGKTAHVYPLVADHLEEASADIASSEYADAIDYLLVSYREYIFSDEQYERLSQIARERGYDEFYTTAFLVEGGAEDPANSVSAEDSDYMKYIETFCPRDSYTPEFILSINLGCFVVLVKK